MLKVIDNLSGDKKILAEAEGIKIANKWNLFNFEDLEYCQEHGYFNVTVGNRIKVQILIKEKTILYRFDDHYKELSENVRFTLDYLAYENVKTNVFATKEAVYQYLMMIERQFFIEL